MYAWGLFNKEYGLTRLGGEHPKHDNIGDVVEDEERWRLTLGVLKVPEKNIKILRDVTYDEVDDIWDELKQLYRAAEKNKTNTLFLFWYGGHGEMGGSAFTQISLNVGPDVKPNKRCYPWESSLMTLTGRENTCTLAFFDCCRN